MDYREFHRVPGDPRRHYVNAHGVEISKRQYDTLRRGTTNEAYARARRELGPSPMRGYSQLIGRIAEQRGVSKGEVRRDVEVSELWAQFQAERQRARMRGRDVERGPRSQLARVLVAMGRRRPEWTWDVGDTPDGGG